MQHSYETHIKQKKTFHRISHSVRCGVGNNLKFYIFVQKAVCVLQFYSFLATKRVKNTILENHKETRGSNICMSCDKNRNKHHLYRVLFLKSGKLNVNLPTNLKEITK